MKGLLWPWIVFEWVGQGLQVGLDRHYGFRKETGKAALRDNFRSSGTHGAAVCTSGWVGLQVGGWVGRVGLVINRHWSASSTSINLPCQHPFGNMSF